jgi:3-oxoacyl-[acyl-carrier-protein] synthase III
MWTLRDKYAIAGTGYTDYSKNSGTTVLNLAAEACLNAIDDAGLAPEDVDGLVSFQFNDSVPAMSVAGAMGIEAAQYALDIAGGGNAANLVVLNAIAAIEAGLAKNVLCFRAMNGRSGLRLGGGRDMHAHGITQFTAPFGWIT